MPTANINISQTLNQVRAQFLYFLLILCTLSKCLCSIVPGNFHLKLWSFCLFACLFLSLDFFFLRKKENNTTSLSYRSVFQLPLFVVLLQVNWLFLKSRRGFGIPRATDQLIYLSSLVILSYYFAFGMSKGELGRRWQEEHFSQSYPLQNEHCAANCDD